MSKLLFEASLAEGLVFRRAIQAVADMLQIANIEFAPDTGVTIEAIDSSHVALVSLNLPVAAFEHYQCRRKLSLGLSLTSILQLLRSMDEHDSLALEIESDRELGMRLCGRRGDRRYQVKVIEIETERLEVPYLEYPAVARMSSSNLRAVLSQLSQFAACVHITVAPGALSFSAAGASVDASVHYKTSDQVDEKAELSSAAVLDECVAIKMEEGAGTVKVWLALNVLLQIAKGDAVSRTVSLHFQQGQPLKVRYEDERGRCLLTHYLAPRVDEDA